MIKFKGKIGDIKVSFNPMPDASNNVAITDRIADIYKTPDAIEFEKKLKIFHRELKLNSIIDAIGKDEKI